MASSELFRTVDSRYGKLTIFANDSGAVSESLLKYGEWAENELSFLHAMIDEGATIVDVGAYIGTHTLAFSRFVGPAGRVVAIEPQTRTFEVLKGNIAANAIDNVRLEHAVASFETGNAVIPSIDIERQDSFGSASVRDALPSIGGLVADRPHDAGDLAVRVMTIDDLGVADCALIKIDVEGAEDLVLRGAAETIRRNAPIIYAECNSLERGLKSVEALRAVGYRVLAHVVAAYNPNNFLGNGHNLFDAAREVALVGIAGPNIERVARYQVQACEMLLDIETADDLALALLNKPQYEPEVLRASAAAKSGGILYLDAVVDNRVQAKRLRYEIDNLNPLAIERAQELDGVRKRLDLTDVALAQTQRLAVERAEESDGLRKRLDLTDVALAETQRLAIERAEQIDKLQQHFDAREVALEEARRLAEERAEEIEQLQNKGYNSLVQAGLARQEANRLRQEASRLQEGAHRFEAKNDGSLDEVELQRERAIAAEAALTSIYRSRSWRFLAPARAITTLLRRARVR